MKHLWFPQEHANINGCMEGYICHKHDLGKIAEKAVHWHMRIYGTDKLAGLG